MIKIISRIILLAFVIVGLIYGYYWAMQQRVVQRGEEESYSFEDIKSLANQEGLITISGELISVDNNYYVQLENKVQVGLKPSQISPISFVGKRVEITGTISGDKLSISKIQEL